jgi:hypothetical protein
VSGSPVPEPAPAGDGPGRRLALVVAVTDYLDTSLRRLRAPAGDAAELRDVLADPDIGGFSVTSVVNEKAHQIRVAVEDFLADRHHDDLLLVYLSCHGLVDAHRRLYFAGRDTLKHRLASSGIESSWLLDQLEDCRARRQVVILDCCFSGAFARRTKGDDELGLGERLVGEGRGRVVLTASRGSEYSFEGEPLQGEDSPRGSVFTSALIHGIRSGGADTDHDGAISVEDAYAYAFEEVRRAGAEQTPQRWLYGAEGSILLAHTPPSLASAAPPPEDSAGPAPYGSGRESPQEFGQEPLHRSGQPPPKPPHQPSPEQSPDPSPQPGRPWKRTAVLAAVAVGIAAVGALVAVLLTQGKENDPNTAGASASGTFTQESPWRLQIKDDISDVSGGDDVGCSVTLTNDDSGALPREWDDFYGTKTFQMRESGSFSWQVNDRGCQLLPHPGNGGVSDLPFPWPASEGDSPVFESAGSVTVRVEDREGTSECELSLRSDANGQLLDTRDAAEDQASVVLESNGPRRVFIEATTCSIRVLAP